MYNTMYYPSRQGMIIYNNNKLLKPSLNPFIMGLHMLFLLYAIIPVLRDIPCSYTLWQFHPYILKEMFILLVLLQAVILWAVYNHWAGPVDWTGELDWWTR